MNNFPSRCHNYFIVVYLLPAEVPKLTLMLLSNAIQVEGDKRAEIRCSCAGRWFFFCFRI